METITVNRPKEVPQCGRCKGPAEPLFMVLLDAYEVDPEATEDVDYANVGIEAKRVPRCEKCKDIAFASMHRTKRTRKPAAGGSSDG